MWLYNEFFIIYIKFDYTVAGILDFQSMLKIQI